MAAYRSANMADSASQPPNANYASDLRAGNVRQLSINAGGRGPAFETGLPRSARANLLVGLRTNNRAATVPEPGSYAQPYHTNGIHPLEGSSPWNYYNHDQQSATIAHSNSNVPMFAPSALHQHNQQQQLLMQHLFLQQNQRAGLYQNPTLYYQNAVPANTSFSSNAYQQTSTAMHEEYNMIRLKKEKLEQQLLKLQRQDYQRQFEQMDESLRKLSVPDTRVSSTGFRQNNELADHAYSSFQKASDPQTRMPMHMAGQHSTFPMMNTFASQSLSSADYAQFQLSTLSTGNQPTPQHFQHYMLPLDITEPPNPPFAAYDNMSYSPPPGTPTFRAQVTPPCDNIPNPLSNWRSQTPPKLSISVSATPAVEGAAALPPPSAKAFRPAHRKGLSIAVVADRSGSSEAPRTGVSRPLQTPLTGTFDPGHAREGEHAIRQPKLPPSIEELIAKPTSKHEGSKNFASRQRNRAVFNLVRAGLERRSASPRLVSGSMSSSSSGTRGSVGDGEAASSNTTASPLSDQSQSDVFGWTEKRAPTPGDKSPASMIAIGSERKALKVKRFE